MIYLQDAEQKIVTDILKKIIPNAHVVVFGSRATGNIKPFSDLDLAIDEKKPISLETLTLLKEAFSESNLSFRVDIVDMHTISEEFLNIINQDKKVIQE